MPRRRVRGKRPKRRPGMGGAGRFVTGGGPNGVVRMRFRNQSYAVISSASGFTASVVNVHPYNTCGDVITGVCIQFEHYRITKLRVSAWAPFVGFPSGSGGTALSSTVAVSCNFEQVRSSNPGGFSSMSQDPYYDCAAPGKKAVIEVDRLVSKGPLRWYRCDFTGSPPADETYQAILTFGWFQDSSNDGSYRGNVLIEGEIEFSDPIENTIEYAKTDRPLPTITLGPTAVASSNDVTDEKSDSPESTPRLKPSAPLVSTAAGDVSSDDTILVHMPVVANRPKIRVGQGGSVRRQ